MEELNQACRTGDSGTVKSLLELTTNKPSPYIALEIAIRNDRLDCFRLLLESDSGLILRFADRKLSEGKCKNYIDSKLKDELGEL